MVVSGAPGTGKSTIARELGGGQLIEVDTGRPGAGAAAVAAVRAAIG